MCVQCMRRPMVHMNLRPSLSTLDIEARSPAESGTGPLRLIPLATLAGDARLCLSRVGIRWLPHLPAFDVGAGEPNCGPPVYKASTLPMKSPLHLFI